MSDKLEHKRNCLRRLYAKRRQRGECIRCGKPAAEGCTRCEMCLVRAREDYRGRKEKRLSRGLCVRCGSHPYARGYTRCKECLPVVRSEEERKERRRASVRKYEWGLRQKAFDHYGRKCVCCGESQEEFLVIDHVNNDGAQHRKRVGNNIYRWLRDNSYPQGFQILCQNCNWGRYVNNGICPHKLK